MVEIVAGLVAAFALGVPVAYAERQGPLPLYLATLVLLVGGLVVLFTLGERLLIETSNPLLLVSYLIGVLVTQRLANRWWGRERFWRRGTSRGSPRRRA